MIVQRVNTLAFAHSLFLFVPWHTIQHTISPGVIADHRDRSKPGLKQYLLKKNYYSYKNVVTLKTRIEKNQHPDL